ncbi:MAG: DUF1491 family protein [Sphingomonas sp.]|jgi:hypothetical protein|nr:DUF1491 family protein [Sphingomonas sp.]
MSGDRLAPGIEASSLIRRAEANGDFAMLLRRGDPDRGSLLIVIRSRGPYVACLHRTLSPDGAYRWATTGPAESSLDEEVADFLARQARFDADLWLIELDIAQPERFIAETTSAA